MSDFGIFRGFSEKLFEGAIPVNLGLIGSDSIIGILDNYPNASIAFSLRKLTDNFTGSAIRVRRASDNTEQNIGFINNVLDTSSLTSFCSGTNGFVTTWYDQSGNGRNATQTTAANQPQIVSSGSIITENSKPSLKFDGSNDSLSLVDINVGSNTSIIGVSTAASGTIYWRYGIFDYWYLEGNQSFRYRNGDFNNLWTSANGVPNMNNIQKLIATYKNSNSTLLSINGSDISTAVSGTGTAGNFNNIGSNSLYLNGYFQELIVYASNQSSNRTGIQTNINDFYSIY
jgi:hypothetical protein